MGGGHAHLPVLMGFAMKPLSGVRLSLVTRDSLTPYSGMLPGMLAGHYSVAEAHIDLGRLSRFAGARHYHAAATGLDLEQRLIRFADRPPLAFDLLSIDIGSTPKTGHIAGAEDFAIPVKPVDRFRARWADLEPGLVARVRQGREIKLAVVGAGAAGVEVSLCLQHYLGGRIRAAAGAGPSPALTVLTDEAKPLAGHSDAVQRHMTKVLNDRGITLKVNAPVRSIDAKGLETAAGERISADAVFLLTQASPPDWLNETGLDLDEDGFIAVGADLRSSSHDFVFASGDIASFQPRRLPKSGVYAVRQGPILQDNLRRQMSGRATRPFRPQKQTLALISTGDQNAIASYGKFATTGPWVWRWKDWIDRRWMKKYQDLPEMAAADGDGEEAMRCGGCGAKIANNVLRQALAEIPHQSRGDIVIGLDAPDDAAVLRPPADRVLVQSIDNFRPFIEDPYLFARITVNHCLGDLFAMGAAPHSALANIVLPFAREAKVAADLGQVMGGLRQGLEDAGVALIGGHTAEGAEMSLGLTVNGWAKAEALTRKAGLVPGDKLILSKALGTGVILAGDMRYAAESAWLEMALRGMLQSNQGAGDILRRHGARSCTDVTGFGLLGHLSELLEASGVSADLDLERLPVLDGALTLFQAGIQSSLQRANEDFAQALQPGHGDQPRYPLLFDPQTAGGLLAGVAAAAAEACLNDLHDAGYAEAAVIGEVTEKANFPCRIRPPGP